MKKFDLPNIGMGMNGGGMKGGIPGIPGIWQQRIYTALEMTKTREKLDLPSSYKAIFTLSLTAYGSLGLRCQAWCSLIFTVGKVHLMWVVYSLYEVKKNQRHTTNKKPNMYKDIKKDN